MPLADLEHAVAPRLARDRVGRVDAQAVAVELEARARVHHPDPGRRHAARQGIEGLGRRGGAGRRDRDGGRRPGARVRGEGEARRRDEQQRGHVRRPGGPVGGGAAARGGADRGRPRGSPRREAGPPRRRSAGRPASAAAPRERPAGARRGPRTSPASGGGSAASRRDRGSSDPWLRGRRSDGAAGPASSAPGRAEPAGVAAAALRRARPGASLRRHDDPAPRAPKSSPTGNYRVPPPPATREAAQRPTRGRGKARAAAGERSHGTSSAQEGTWRRLWTTTEGGKRKGAPPRARARTTA